MPTHQIGVEGVRMVEIEGGALLEGQVAQIVIVRIVVEHGDPFRAEGIDDAV